MNTVQIVGRLGADPELRFTKDGEAICTLKVATDSWTKNNDGWVSNADWHTIKVFRKQANSCAKFLRKGNFVGVSGSIRYNKFKDPQTGNMVYYTQILANKIDFLRTPEEMQQELIVPEDHLAQQQSSREFTPKEKTTKQLKEPIATPEVIDDDIPYQPGEPW